MAKQITERDNFTYLTIALVILLFSTAVVDQFFSAIGQYVVHAVTVVTLMVAVWSVNRAESWYRTRLGFIVAIAIISALGVFLDKSGLDYAYLLIMLACFSITIWYAGRQVLFSGPIDANKILGAICIYFLLGLAWAVVYLLIALMIPGAFNGQEAMPWYDNFPDFTYFSFVSLSTLGFGDISPAIPITRFLVYMEAIVGQFYIAIIVASLVGIRISGYQR